MAKIYGRAIGTAAGGAVPDLFGDGSDGDLIVHNAETKTLEVLVPQQSVIEMQYNSIRIDAGGLLNCSDFNAGLILRCKGDCTIQGTIDQSGKAPKTNPNNNYQYPPDVWCGTGGNGGNGAAADNGTALGGTGQAPRAYGGGYGAGGAGGLGFYRRVRAGTIETYKGGNGGDSTGITIDVDPIFVGTGLSGYGYTANPVAGQFGGGGQGNGFYSKGESNDYRGYGGEGASGAGTDGGNSSDSGHVGQGGGGGAAGNVGGGIVLLYVGGNLTIEGTVSCNGLPGGNGLDIDPWSPATPGSGGGGGGGGSIYIVYNGEIVNTGNLQANGGTGGTGQLPGNAGGLGTVTVKKYERGMTA